MTPFCEFGIAPGQKNAAESFQLGLRLLMIVNFAVSDQAHLINLPRKKPLLLVPAIN